MDIDFKKMLEQDEKFKLFVKEVLFEAAQQDSENLKYFYAMYQSGLKAKQVAEMMRWMR